MTQIKNRTHLKVVRRNLRNNPTAPEQKLWYFIRGRQCKGYKFRRQYSLGKFIIDFYCAEQKLAIEIDGDSHYAPMYLQYDTERTQYLKLFAVTVLRFTNSDVMNNVDGVVEEIIKHLP